MKREWFFTLYTSVKSGIDFELRSGLGIARLPCFEKTF